MYIMIKSLISSLPIFFFYRVSAFLNEPNRPALGKEQNALLWICASFFAEVGRHVQDEVRIAGREKSCE